MHHLEFLNVNVGIIAQILSTVFTPLCHTSLALLLLTLFSEHRPLSAVLSMKLLPFTSPPQSVFSGCENPVFMTRLLLHWYVSLPPVQERTLSAEVTKKLTCNSSLSTAEFVRTEIKPGTDWRQKSLNQGHCLKMYPGVRPAIVLWRPRNPIQLHERAAWWDYRSHPATPHLVLRD